MTPDTCDHMFESQNNYATWKKAILRISFIETLEILEATSLCYSDKKLISGYLGLVVRDIDWGRAQAYLWG